MKRGSISIETIIIIILALLVLVIVAAAFSGGMAELWKRVIGISESTGTTSLASAKAECASLCSDKTLYCATSKTVDGTPRRCQDLNACPALDCSK